MAGNKDVADILKRNAAAREAIASDPERTAERLSGLDRNSYDFSGYSDSDIVRAYQGADFGEDDYRRLTGKGSSSPTEESPTVGITPIVETNPPPFVDNGINQPVSVDINTDIDSRGGDIFDNVIKGDNNNVSYDSSSNVTVSNAVNARNNALNGNFGSNQVSSDSEDQKKYAQGFVTDFLKNRFFS